VIVVVVVHVHVHVDVHVSEAVDACHVPVLDYLRMDS
jgi:hypothetical protein